LIRWFVSFFASKLLTNEKLLSDGSQICLKLQKLQAQTSQYEMTIHADEHKFGEFARECKFI